MANTLPIVKFDCSKKDYELASAIAARAIAAAAKVGMRLVEQEMLMDIVACHANGMPLRLQELLDADSFNFNHDVFGIRRYLNRETGELGGCFVPRFAVR